MDEVEHLEGGIRNRHANALVPVEIEINGIVRIAGLHFKARRVEFAVTVEVFIHVEIAVLVNILTVVQCVVVVEIFIDIQHPVAVEIFVRETGRKINHRRADLAEPLRAIVEEE